MSQAIRIASQSGVSMEEEVMGFQTLIGEPLSFYGTPESSRVVSYPEFSLYAAAPSIDEEEDEEEDDWDDEDEDDEEDWDEDEDEDEEEDEEEDDWDDDYDEDEDDDEEDEDA